jgi:type VI secretion system protein VasJ
MDTQHTGSQPERVARWLAAISAAKPAGENARHDPDHEALRTAVSNLEGLQGTPVDWAAFSSQAEALVTTRSKDLLIASYLAYALLQTEGARGFAEGLALVSGILEQYWDTCFPDVARVRARGNALSWLVERAARQFSEGGGVAGDPQALAAVAEQTRRFQQVVTSRFDAGTISVGSLVDAVGEPSSAANGAPAVAPESAAAPPAPQAPVVEEASTSVEPSDTLADATPDADTTGAKLAELALPFATPIPGVNPGGENARHDPKHEAIREEVAKLNRATSGEVDWKLVRDSGRALLEEQSKDFVIACYFAVASYVLEGIGGLVTGIAAISALLQDHWDDGYPPVKRLRGRINAIDWFVERVDSLGHLVPKEVGDTDFQLLSRAATDLQDLVFDRFEDEAPSIYGLKETLGRIELSMVQHAPPTAEPAQPEAPEAAAATADASAAPAEPKPAAPAPRVDLAVPSQSMSNPDEVLKFLRTVGGSLHKASEAFFKAAPSDPLSYRIARRGLYLHFIEAPPASNGNRTAVRPPPGDTEPHLNALLSSKDFATLLDQAESALGQYRLWFDLHRYVATALGGLGHDAARDTVVAETLSVVQRLPELLEREFSDGRPFASPETRQWLSASGFGSSSTAGVDGGSDELDQQLAQAQQLALGGKLEEAVKALSAIAGSQDLSGRDRFRAKLAMAKASAAAGAHRLAEGILAGLSAEIEQFQLEEWEPKLAEACYRSRYEALSAMGTQSEQARQTLLEVYRQLCRVTPLAALELSAPTRGR